MRGPERVLLALGFCGLGSCQPPAREFPVRVTGEDFRWQIRYPGPDGVLDSDDDRFGERHLEVPARSTVHLDLRSTDFVYSFYLPDVPVLEVALPGQPVVISFPVGEEQTLELLGNQMCGYTHPELLGEVRVRDEPGDQPPAGVGTRERATASSR